MVGSSHLSRGAVHVVRHDRPLRGFLLVVNAALLVGESARRGGESDSEFGGMVALAVDDLRNLGAWVVVRMVVDEFGSDKRKEAFRAWVDDCCGVDAAHIFETAAGECGDVLAAFGDGVRHFVFVESVLPQPLSELATQKVVVIRQPGDSGEVPSAVSSNVVSVSGWPFVAPAAVSLAIGALP